MCVQVFFMSEMQIRSWHSTLVSVFKEKNDTIMLELIIYFNIFLSATDQLQSHRWVKIFQFH